MQGSRNSVIVSVVFPLSYMYENVEGFSYEKVYSIVFVDTLGLQEKNVLRMIVSAKNNQKYEWKVFIIFVFIFEY